MTTREELKACPFCKSDNVIKGYSDNGEHEEAECLDCGAGHNLGLWQNRSLPESNVERVNYFGSHLIRDLDILRLIVKRSDDAVDADIKRIERIKCALVNVQKIKELLKEGINHRFENSTKLERCVEEALALLGEEE